MIQISNVSKVYKSSSGEVKAIDKVSLEIKEGEIYGIIGFSGAGKSTLIRCINMLEKPTSGSITVAGQEVTALGARDLRQSRQKISMIFQHFNLLTSRTVFDNVAFPLEIAGVPTLERKEKVMRLLSLVGLEDKAQAYPSQLSGGQKQRVGIARALANDPKVLLCDEATSALDPQTTDSILSLLKDINRRLNLTILLITHEMRVITQICDRVAVMEAGQVIEEGSVMDVFTAPEKETTKQFVKTVINTELPDEIKKGPMLHPKGQLVRLSFVGESTGSPVISALVKEFGLDVNILYANIDYIQEVPFGILAIELIGPTEKRCSALEYLKQRGLGIEVINHAS